MAAPLLRRNSRDPGIFPSVLRPLVNASGFSLVGCSDPRANQIPPDLLSSDPPDPTFRARASRRELAQVLVSRPYCECPGSGDFPLSDNCLP